MTTLKEYKFLSESNNIEDVWDDESLKLAVKAWNYLKKQPQMTPDVVLKTHKILMKDHLPDDAGKFRKCRIFIGDREGRPWETIPLKIGGWCFSTNKTIADLNEPNKSKEKEECAKQHHIYFEKIHPFVDGNGRTGRMFLNWMRLKMGLPIFTILEAEKYYYYKWFEDSQGIAY